MELYILSKQDLSILSICKLADYQINLDEETNAKSTFTLMKTNGLKKENYMVLNGLYRQFIFVIDDVQTEKESDVVTVTALDISNVFNRKVIEKNINTMKSKSIEEFLANTISENFVNSNDTALNVNYIEIYWHTNTQGNVATNAENGLYNFHTFLTNCRQYKNIYTDFKLENLGNPQTVEGKRINVEAKNRKIVDISLHGETSQKTRSGKNLCDDRFSSYAISSYGYKKIIDRSVSLTATLIDKDTSVDLSGVYFGFTGNGENANAGVAWLVQNGSKSNISTNLNLQYFSFFPANEKTFNKIFSRYYIQIEEGEASTYEPYGVMPSPDYPSEIENIEGNIEFKATNGLEEIDENYQEQVATFPLGEGQKLMEGSYLADDGIHHKRKQVVLDGTETGWYTLANQTGTNTSYFCIPKSDMKKASTLICDKFINRKVWNTDEEGIQSFNLIRLRINTSRASTVAELKTWLSNNPITVEYELAEPETVPYTEEQQTAWDNIKNLTLFEGVNHISADANMVLKYYPLEPVGLKFVLRIDIENKQETTELIDTTLPEVTDYNKIYEEDVTAKVQVYIREDGSEYNLYLKTDRTTTTNKDDPDRASGKIEVISVETADKAEEEALNVMKGNNYKHLVEFKIAKTSKLMDIKELFIGRPIRIKTDDDIYDSYISAITLSDENFVYFKSGRLRITLLDKLKKSNNSTGNKLDVTGGKILGNLNILDNAYFGKNGVAFGAPYDTEEGGPLQVDGARIIESGSNDNGSWTKWSDGTMICRNKVDNIAIETKQNMSNKNIIYYGYANDGWTYFPQEFIEPPTTILNLNTGLNCFGIQPYEQQYSDRPPGFYPLSVDPTLTGVISISYIAIGRWK